MSDFQYSDKYTSEEDEYEYRAVTVRKEKINRLMTEDQVKSLGIVQSPGWEHYANYPPDNVMLFRRIKSKK